MMSGVVLTTIVLATSVNAMAYTADVDRTFVHIPRTAGISTRNEFGFRNVWHSSHTAPPPPNECTSSTSLRNETDRYCSEWGFYGLQFFARRVSVKGWTPHNGYHATFESFVNDSSTHNSQTKILSGCTLYDNHCCVNETSVEHIVARIRSGCLKLVPLPRLRVHTQAMFRCSTLQRSMAYRANYLDRLLLMRIRSESLYPTIEKFQHNLRPFSYT